MKHTSVLKLLNSLKKRGLIGIVTQSMGEGVSFKEIPTEHLIMAVDACYEMILKLHEQKLL